MVAALKLSKMEQHRAFEKKIRKDGILKMNVSVMEKGHNLVRERRQGSCNNADGSGSVHSTKSWRSAESLRVTEEFKSVIDSFRNDEAGRLYQSDSLIILFGKRLWAKSI